MGLISVAEGRDGLWDVAGWAMRQMMADVQNLHPDGELFREAFELAEIYNGLIIDSFEEEFARRMVTALKDTAEGITSGRLHSGVETKDLERQRQYKGALPDLLRVLDRYQGPVKDEFIMPSLQVSEGENTMAAAKTSGTEVEHEPTSDGLPIAKHLRTFAKWFAAIVVILALSRFVQDHNPLFLIVALLAGVSIIVFSISRARRR